MAKAKDDFVVVSAMGSNAIDFTQKNQSVTGFFQGYQTGVGRYDSNVYTFKDEKGKEFTIWGSASLDGILPHCKKGEKIRVTFLERKKIEGSKNKVKRFKVESTDATMMDRVNKANEKKKQQETKKGRKTKKR